LRTSVVRARGLSASGLWRIQLAKRIQPPVRSAIYRDRSFPAARQLRPRRQELSADAALSPSVMRAADVHAGMSASVYACRNEVQTERNAPCGVRIWAYDDGSVIRRPRMCQNCRLGSTWHLAKGAAHSSCWCRRNCSLQQVVGVAVVRHGCGPR
jgi:hypothetical protein